MGGRFGGCWRIKVLRKGGRKRAFEPLRADAFDDRRMRRVGCVAQQTVEAFQFGFEFACFSFCSEQRRREAGFEGAGFIDGA